MCELFTCYRLFYFYCKYLLNSVAGYCDFGSTFFLSFYNAFGAYCCNLGIAGFVSNLSGWSCLCGNFCCFSNFTVAEDLLSFRDGFLTVILQVTWYSPQDAVITACSFCLSSYNTFAVYRSHFCIAGISM